LTSASAPEADALRNSAVDGWVSMLAKRRVRLAVRDRLESSETISETSVLL